ncbi:MAG TPA: hypothetical protein VK511_09100, partial [Gemmatimonadaceae bacterium]|nr:hypothetical protein [Gemmatimonadaceae bacterium]
MSITALEPPWTLIVGGVAGAIGFFLSAMFFGARWAIAAAVVAAIVALVKRVRSAAIAHLAPTNNAKKKKQIAPAIPPTLSAHGGSSARALAPLASVGVRQVRCSAIGSVMDQSFLAATLGRRYGTL